MKFTFETHTIEFSINARTGFPKAKASSYSQGLSSICFYYTELASDGLSANVMMSEVREVLNFVEKVKENGLIEDCVDFSTELAPAVITNEGIDFYDFESDTLIDKCEHDTLLLVGKKWLEFLITNGDKIDLTREAWFERHFPTKS